MPATDDLGLIRSLLDEPQPPALVFERGRSRLAELVAAQGRDQAAGAPPGGARPTRRARRGRWPVPAAAWVAASTGLAAAGTAAAIVIATGTPGVAGHRSGRPVSQRAAVLPVLGSARQILLTAATHAAAARPGSGAYWHVAVVTGQVLPGGTRAHPFDIVTRGPSAKWYARVAGQREWAISRPPTTARPMTAADWAAWRAAGSPRGWRLGWIWRDKRYVPNNNGLSMTPAAVEKVWQHSNGVVGHIEGVQPGLTARQFAALPSTSARLRAYLFRLAQRLARPGPTSAGGLPASYLVWIEGSDLLTDPVSPRVLAATFRVLAGLARVRSLGLVRDPLNRPGYALGLGREVIVVNPVTGTLLAYEYLKDVAAIRPGETLCKVHGSYGVIQGRQPISGPISRNCTYYPGYYGRAYDGPLSVYTAIVAAGWVSSLPPVPRATKANHSSGGF